MQSSQSGGSHRKSKRGHFLTIKASIQKEDITLVNISASNVGTFKEPIRLADSRKPMSLAGIFPCRQLCLG